MNASTSFYKRATGNYSLWSGAKPAPKLPINRDILKHPSFWTYVSSQLRPILIPLFLFSAYTWNHPSVLIPIATFIGVMFYVFYLSVIDWPSSPSGDSCRENYIKAQIDFSTNAGAQKNYFIALIAANIVLIPIIIFTTENQPILSALLALSILGGSMYLAASMAKKQLQNGPLSSNNQALVGLQYFTETLSIWLLAISMVIAIFVAIIYVVFAIIFISMLLLAAKRGHFDVDLFSPKTGSSSESKPVKFWTSKNERVIIEKNGEMWQRGSGSYLGRVDQEGAVFDKTGHYEGKMGSDGKLIK